ncbi:MAG TPA: squalene/phytoene synthase family protein, partial [Acetobacteraceae bacterium]
RLYLPREFLDQAGVPAEPQAALRHPALPSVCERVAKLAHAHFADAQAWMGCSDGRAMKPARLMGATYAAILDLLERRGWNRLDVPAPLPKWRKLWIALRYGML